MPKPDREEFLEDDPEISGQKFCLLSFLSPEKVLTDKNVFLFAKFVQQYEFNMRLRNLEQFLGKTIQGINTKLDEQAVEFDKRDLSGVADLCRASRIRVDTTMDALQNFVKENEGTMKESSLKEQYDDFLYKNREKLEDEFFSKNNFQTTVRGLKIRGVYASQSEAELRSKKLQRSDPLHNIYIGEIGKWLPWDPSPVDVPNQEYAEDQLNTLMKKYKENEEAREMFMRENRQRLQRNTAPMSVTREETNAAAAPAELNSMFNGPADLAIQRKMEKKE
jgi:hypothetical protein